MLNIIPDRMRCGSDEFINYYKENDDKYWYSFRDVINALFISERKADEIFNKWLNDNEKTWFDETNPLNNQSFKVRYVTSNGLYRIINRNNKRANEIIKLMINNETKNNNDYREFKNSLNDINTQLSINESQINYINVALSIKNIYESEPYRDVLDKAGIIDKEKEQIIDDFREDIYDYNVDEITWGVVKRRDENSEEFEEKQILYKKRRKEKSESSAPSWLKYIVK